jgi:2-methylcitrate dehydratase PrpD
MSMVNMNKDGNEVAASFMLETTWDTLPTVVKQRNRMCLLDNLASAIAGMLTHVGKISADYAASRFSGDEATILLNGKRATIQGAAFANACAANGLDIDDGSKYTRGHPGAQVFPTALAVAEKTGADGREFLASMAVGYEIALYTGRCWHMHHYEYQACGAWGSVACAAVAAYLLKLDMTKIKNALGIAEYHSPNVPMMRDIDNPAMVKHGIGWGAMTGIAAAELAQLGYTGIPSILGLEKFRDWVSNLGSKFLILDGVYHKQWCSCAWAHPSILAAAKLVEENRIHVEDIAKIQVYTFHEGWRLWQPLPDSEERAQFSIKWPLAAYLVYGEVGPQQVLSQRLNDKKIISLFEKIEVIEDAEIEQAYRRYVEEPDLPGAKFSSRVKITLADNHSVESSAVEQKEIKWDERLIEQKFRRFAGYVLNDSATEQLIDIVRRCEDIPDVREIIRLCRQMDSKQMV